MPDVTLRILDVFRLSITPGPMVFCTSSGEVFVGDVFEFRPRGSGPVYGTVFTLNPHVRPDAGPDELNLGIKGDVARYLEPGVRLHRVQSPA